MANDTFYFSHDYNARTDPKIKRLIVNHGLTGYGAYWAIIEDLYNNANALPTHYDCIAFDLRLHVDVVKSIINEYDLFFISGDYFGSKSVERRLNARNEKSIKARESAKKRWEEYERNANAMRTHSDGNAIKERKGKEINNTTNVVFGDFWDLYDKKVGDKIKLKAKWDKLRDVERLAIMNHLPKYKTSQPDKQFRKDPSTYLSNRSWEDEIIGEQPVTTKSTKKETTDEEFREFFGTNR